MDSVIQDNFFRLDFDLDDFISTRVADCLAAALKPSTRKENDHQVADHSINGDSECSVNIDSGREIKGEKKGKPTPPPVPPRNQVRSMIAQIVRSNTSFSTCSSFPSLSVESWYEAWISNPANQEAVLNADNISEYSQTIYAEYLHEYEDALMLFDLDSMGEFFRNPFLENANRSENKKFDLTHGEGDSYTAEERWFDLRFLESLPELEKGYTTSSEEEAFLKDQTLASLPDFSVGWEVSIIDEPLGSSMAQTSYADELKDLDELLDFLSNGTTTLTMSLRNDDDTNEVVRHHLEEFSLDDVFAITDETDSHPDEPLPGGLTGRSSVRTLSIRHFDEDAASHPDNPLPGGLTARFSVFEPTVERFSDNFSGIHHLVNHSESSQGNVSYALHINILSWALGVVCDSDDAVSRASVF